MLPLDAIRVLDFSTLLPGPLASLILAEAGAEVIKVERPGGEDMRRYAPFVMAQASTSRSSIAASPRSRSTCAQPAPRRGFSSWPRPSTSFSSSSGQA